ncbi:MAG: hypothetical protein CME61_09115 [Halobacteriovoraceae bacterium]|nr:hypothetical protein [Halobacteriovoraceae bacterium]
MTQLALSPTAAGGSLRRGYLEEDENTGRARPLAFRLMGKRAFIFCDHRLPSLYRNATLPPSWLTNSHLPSSSYKYPTGVRGCETPATTSPLGGAI